MKNSIRYLLLGLLISVTAKVVAQVESNEALIIDNRVITQVAVVR